MVKVRKKLDKLLNKIFVKSWAGARYVTGILYIYSDIEIVLGVYLVRLGKEEDLYIFGI